jgi:hypothetical protein
MAVSVIFNVRPGAETDWGSESILNNGSTYPPSIWFSQSAPFENGLATKVSCLGRNLLRYTIGGAAVPGAGYSHPDFAGRNRYLLGEPQRPGGGTRNEWHGNTYNQNPRNDGNFYAYQTSLWLPDDWFQGISGGQHHHLEQFWGAAGSAPNWASNIQTDREFRWYRETSSGGTVWEWQSKSLGSSWNSYGWTSGLIPLRQWWDCLRIIRWSTTNTGDVYVYINPDPLGKSGPNPGYIKVWEVHNFATCNGDSNRTWKPASQYGQRGLWYWDNVVMGKMGPSDNLNDLIAAVTPVAVGAGINVTASLPPISVTPPTANVTLPPPPLLSGNIPVVIL